MKKVIDKEPKHRKETLASDVAQHRYYGVKRGDDKGFITATGFMGNFKVVMMDGLTYANGLVYANGAEPRHENIANLVSDLISKGIEAYEFLTPERLCAWLADISSEAIRVVEKLEDHNEVRIDDVTPLKFYGACRSNGEHRGIVHVPSVSGIRRFVTPKELQRFIDEEKMDVYEFDMLEELFQWVAKDPARQ